MAQESLFGQLGFPQQSQGDLLKQRAEKEQRVFEELISERAAALPANDRRVFSAFANLGRNILGKPEAELTDEEKRKFQIMESTNKIMKAQQAAPEWKDLDPRERALRSQEAMAKAALEAGDMQTFSQLALDSANKRLSYKKAEKELENLEGQIGSRKVTDEYNETRTRLANSGSPGQFYAFDPDNPGAEPTLVAGNVDPDTGELIGADGENYGSYMTVNAYTERLQEARLAKAEGTGSVANSVGVVRDMYSTGQIGTIRDSISNVKVTGNIVKTLSRGLQGQAKQGRDPETAIATPGRVVKAIDNATRLANQAYKGVGSMINIGGKEVDRGQFEGGENLSVDALAERKEYKEKIRLPEGVKSDSQAAARHRSAVMQLVYLEARMREPGARQLSDADITRAMDTLGVNTNSLEGMMSTVMQSYKLGTTDVRSKINQIMTVADQAGLPYEDAAPLILGERDPLGTLDENVQGVTDEINALLEEAGYQQSDDFTSPEAADATNERRSPQAPQPIDPSQVPEGAEIIRFDENGNPI